jgi:hypothetical protein
MAKFLTCALFYGDHPQLAQRCANTLKSLQGTGKVDLRIGLNAVSPATRAVLDATLPGVHRIDADPQLYKYPMMRKLVGRYDGDATHLMWFDDDTCLQPGTNPRLWLDAVAQRADACAGSLGSVYQRRLTRPQKAWIAAQPWYTGRDIPEAVTFVTGGWTVLPLATMRALDWPPQDIVHNGGDAILGAMLHQQGLPVEQFRMGLAINADPQLRESAAPRRGHTDPPPAVWADWSAE